MGRIENLGRIEISDARLAQLEHALVRLGGHGSGLLRDARLDAGLAALRRVRVARDLGNRALHQAAGVGVLELGPGEVRELVVAQHEGAVAAVVLEDDLLVGDEVIQGVRLLLHRVVRLAEGRLEQVELLLCRSSWLPFALLLVCSAPRSSSARRPPASQRNVSQ